jgi:hypothetical protein
VLDYEIGHDVFMLSGDSWELTDVAPDAIGHTWPVLIHGERGKERKHVQRGFWLGGWDHKVTVPTRIQKINVFHLIKFETNLMLRVG